MVMGRFLLVVLGCLLQQAWPSLAAVDLSDLYAFGPASGDTRAPSSLDDFVTIALPPGTGLNFFNHTYTTLYINNNGGVSFNRGVNQFTPTCTSTATPMIIPFWADVDTRTSGDGDVYYRQTTDPALLAKATTETRAAFPGLVNLSISWLFIVTWYDVAFFRPGCSGNSTRNTFQLVMATDSDTRSYVTFNYNKITWVASYGPSGSGGSCEGIGGEPAKAGFDAGDGQTFYSIPGSCSQEVMNITSTTNVGHDGRWIFRVDQDHVEEAEAEPTTTTTDPLPSNATTTEAPMPTTEPAAPEPECLPGTCLHTGHCFMYSFCNHQRGVWEAHNCSVGLFWNPHHTGNQTLEECFGSCDLWDNLAPETQAAYKSDESCFPAEQCYYEPVEDCGSEYLYHSRANASGQATPTPVRVHCPADTREGMNVTLVWVQDRETCDFCYNALNASSGAACCDRYDAHLPQQDLGSGQLHIPVTTVLVTG